MSLLHLSTTDSPAGASRAAMTVHSLLRERGHRSRMLVLRKRSDDPDIREVPRRRPGLPGRLLARLGLRREPARRAGYVFNFDRARQVVPGALTAEPRGSYDAVLAHWITALATSRDLRAVADHYGCPLLRVMMDMEPVTGGCHQSFGCRRFAGSCGMCPLLESDDPWDESARVLQAKRRYLAPLDITFVCPNSTVRGWVRASSLFGGHRTADVPLPVDGSVFHPGDRLEARRRLGLGTGGPVLMVGVRKTEEPGKGMDLLERALGMLGGALPEPGEVTLLLVGSGGEGFADGSGLAVRRAGYLEEPTSMADAYRAADASVCPSLHDAGPMMIPEAMMCGTPVVAFRTGVAVDLVRDGETGWSAGPGDAEGLAAAMRRALEEREPARLASAAADAAAGHSIESVSLEYVSLLEELTGKGTG